MADQSSLLDLEGSLDPSRLPEVTLGMTALQGGVNSPARSSNHGRLSPVRGRTMKEYDQQISELKKENFSLKMRIYHMDERMNQRYGDSQDVIRTNIELQVEIENLKKELNDKQIIVQKAALAMETLTANRDQAEESMKSRILLEHQVGMDKLKDQLNSALKDCEQSRKEADEANKKVEALKLNLEEVRFDLLESNKVKEELENKLHVTELDVQMLTSQLKLSEQTQDDTVQENRVLISRLKELEEQLQISNKNLSRRDRDIQNLSHILQDQSHVDITPILEPVHHQDDMEDQKEEVERRGAKIEELQACLDNKDSVVRKLEDALRELKNEKSELEVSKRDLEQSLNRLSTKIGRYEKSMVGIMMACHEKDNKCTSMQKTLDENKVEMKKLQEALREAEQEKTKNLIKSLGKKEGELVGFQEQLRVAMDALNKSEEALEALQAQLMAERQEFDLKLKEQALNFQISVNNQPPQNTNSDGLQQQVADLQKIVTNLNSELDVLRQDKGELGEMRRKLQDKEKDIEMLSAEHKRELSSLNKELQALRQQENKAGRQRETQPDSTGVLEEMKTLMDILAKKILSLDTLHQRLQGEEGLSAEILLREISQVQGLYRQLEEGVEKNSRLHQALLNSLVGAGPSTPPAREQLAHAESPDSSSCQDGGHNLISPHNLEAVSTGHSEPSWCGEICGTPGRHSATKDASPGSRCEIHQSAHSAGLKQYSPVKENTEANGTAEQRRTTRSLPVFNSEGTAALQYSPRSRARISRPESGLGQLVHGRTLGDSHHSLTDDAKGSQHLLLEPCMSANYSLHFQQSLYFENDHYDIPRQDRASSIRTDFKPDSGHSLTFSSPGRSSESSGLSRAKDFSKQERHHNSDSHKDTSYSTASRGIRSQHIGTGSIKDSNPLSLMPGSSERPSESNVDEKGQESFRSSHQACTSESHHAALSSVSLPSREGTLYDDFKGTGSLTHDTDASSAVREQELEKKEEEEERGSERHLSGRRNSWAEELEQYRVTNCQDGTPPPRTPSSPAGYVITNRSSFPASTMSAVELRDLVAQLQIDLVEAVKHNHSLRLHLEQQQSQLPDFSVDGQGKEKKGESQNNEKGDPQCKIYRTVGDRHSEPIGSHKVMRRSVSAEKMRAPPKSQQGHSEAEVEELMNKLAATENTVRMLSRKNKAYLSTLQSAGLSCTHIQRSSSENCLSHATYTGGLDVTGMDLWASGDYVDGNVHASTGMTTQDSKTTGSPKSLEQARGGPGSLAASCTFSNVMHMNGSASDLATSGVCGAITEASSNSSPPHASPVKRTSRFSPQRVEQESSRKYRGRSSVSTSCQTDTVDSHLAPDHPEQDENVHTSVLDTSRINRTYGGDVTFHSLIDTTLLNHTLASLSAVVEDPCASGSLGAGLTKGQLHVKLQYLESLNVTLREELKVMDALHNNPSNDTGLRDTDTVSCSPAPYIERGTGGDDNTSDEDDVLRQHLAEIRRLRQRLESLDVDKDPGQLLIFQSHIHQRLSRQEAIISRLQQQLHEKEETWQRAMIEAQHRFAREKATRTEELQHAISQLERSICGQQTLIEELTEKEGGLKKQVDELQSSLAASEAREEKVQEDMTAVTSERDTLAIAAKKSSQELLALQESLARQQSDMEAMQLQVKTAEEREKYRDEELKKLLLEKNELQADLLKRDRDFLEQEETTFRLELAKEKAEKECTRQMESMERLERERRTMQKDIEEYRESSRCLKEIVVKRERSLQDKVQLVQKLQSDVLAADGKVTARNHQLHELEGQLEVLRKEAEGQGKWKEESARLEALNTQLDTDMHKLKEILGERDAKLQKRERQLNHLLSQYKKLESAYVKLRYTLKENLDTVKSQKRQIDYLQALSSCTSQEERNNLMKELVKELVATQKQVEDLLSKLEPNPLPAHLPSVRIETFGPPIATTSSGSVTVTTVTSSTETNMSVGIREELLEGLAHQQRSTTATSTAATTATTTSNSSSVGAVSSQSLYAVHVLEQHEILTRQAGEAQVVVSGLDARLTDRLHTLKAAPISESMEYSTLREASLSCQNLKLCLHEVTRLLALAWTTELPPVDSRGHFYDPVLAEQNETLRHELTRLRSRCDLLDHTVKEQQGRLDATKDRQKHWEASLYRQLSKTVDDMEQAKENMDASLAQLPPHGAALRTRPANH